jgi:hypothetical protein
MGAGTFYAELIKDQLNAEESRKESLEQRGVFVITSSGALATLLFGLAGLITSRKGFTLPTQAEWCLGLALVGFTAAALISLFINRPRMYAAVSRGALRRIIEEERYWKAPEVVGLRRSAESRLNVLEASRVINDQKAELLIWALRCEVAAVALVASAIGAVFAFR